MSDQEDTAELRPGWERCVDCVPFQQLRVQVDGLDAKVEGMKTEIRELRFEIKPAVKQIARVLSLLEGNGKPETGLVYRFFDIEKSMKAYGRLKWIVLGALATGALVLIGALVRDALIRGII